MLTQRPIETRNKQARALTHTLSVLSSAIDDKGERYRQAPYGIERFADEVLGIQLKPYQKRICRALMTHYRVAVRGPHGIGKTTIAAVFNLWMISAYPTDVKVVNTASKWRQLQKFLFPEIKKWARLADWSAVGLQVREARELQSLSLKLIGKESFAVACTDPSAIEGAHAQYLGYVYDESKAIPDATFDATEGAFSNANNESGYVAYALALSTPDKENGRFYDIHARKRGFEDWHPIHVTLDEAISAGMVSEEWAKQRAIQWGKESARYQNRVLGNFAPDASDNQLVSLRMVEDAFDRYEDRLERGVVEGVESLGVDVARKGKDENAVVRMIGNNLTEIARNNYKSTMQATGAIIRLARRDKSLPIGVDEIGVGGGVVDRLAEQDYNVIEVNVAKTSKRRSRHSKDEFDNLYSELRWTVAEMLDKTNFTASDGTVREDDMLALKRDDRLESELIMPRYEELSDARIHVESKKEIERRYKREGKPYHSPDTLDALCASLYARQRQSKRRGNFVIVGNVDSE